MRRSPPRARQGRAEPLRMAAGRLQPLAAAMARQPVRRAAPKAPCSLARLAASSQPDSPAFSPARPWSRLRPRPRHGIAAQPPPLPPARGHRSACGLSAAVRSAQARRGSRSAVGPAGATRPVPRCRRAGVSGAASRSTVGVACAGLTRPLRDPSAAAASSSLCFVASPSGRSPSSRGEHHLRDNSIVSSCLAF
jgi:hypothetical protein